MSTLIATLEVLQSGDFQARWDAAKAISSFGEQAIAPLVKLLQDPGSDLELQWVTARALGEFQHPDALMALATLLCTTEDDEISEIAAETLGSMGAAAIPALAEYLYHHQATLPAVQALACIRDAGTIPLLLQLAEHQQAEIRAAAMEALSAFHRPQVLPALTQALGDPNPDVRQIAVMGLGYRSLEPETVAMIEPLLQDESVLVCQQAALALGRLGVAHPLLERLTTDAPLLLKRTIIQALGRMGDRQALEHLQQALTLSAVEESIDLVRGVVDAIATHQTHQPFATQILVEMLEQSQPPILLQFIATALGQLGQPEAMEPLIGLLAQPDMGVKLHAISALKQLRDCDVTARLQALLEDDKVPQELVAGITVALQEW
ncbi:MAG: HEAT repeat domain-containing protein [Thermosynechococcaceae cyanobacterium]